MAGRDEVRIFADACLWVQEAETATEVLRRANDAARLLVETSCSYCATRDGDVLRFGRASVLMRHTGSASRAATSSAPGGPLLGVIGCQAVHLMDADERGKAPKLQDMWIDIGVTSREEAQQLVPLGTAATRAAQLELLRGDLVVSRALDDKAGLFSVIEAMRRLHAQRERLHASVSFVSAVQEEVGTRGAHTSAYSVEPDIAIAVDVTFPSDHPQTSRQRLGDVKLGGGPGITIGGFVSPRISQKLMAVAKEADIAFQFDVQGAYTGTDNDEIQITRGGVATGLLNIPCRYMHSGSEIVSLKDIDTTAELMARFVLSLDEDMSMIP